MLRDYGPNAQPIRDLLKATVTRVYQHTWNSPRPAERLATIAENWTGCVLIDGSSEEMSVVEVVGTATT